MNNINFEYTDCPITVIKFYIDKGDDEVLDILKKNKDIPDTDNDCQLDFYVSNFLTIWIGVTEFVSEFDCKVYQVPMKNSEELIKELLTKAVDYFEKNNIEYVKDFRYNKYIKGEGK